MRSWERPLGLSLCAISGAWLVVACTLHVEVEMRSTPARAYTSPERRAAVPVDAGAPSLYYGGIGLTVGDGGLGSLSITPDGCEPTSDAGNCESPCAMPLVNCGQWGAMLYDGCRWACSQFGSVTQ